ncbi:hypothetical protein [Pseudomonas urmiensis]|uniref:Uncharacterized protein n=1 Tax=Pseudomonas urmiensis TaxID=2745493 RepID=A0A923FYI5_9PSED|nr:hypothetical protein [Pseudomonas urmiensis]MBV4537363.1 hypothetical protein [Pseudomonas urmiensis]
MTSFHDYEKIQNFKSSGTAFFGGVNYAHVVAPYLYDKSLIGLFKKIIFSLFFSTCVSLEKSKGGSILLYYSGRYKRRADYDYIPQRLRELLGTNCGYAESIERFSLGQAFFTLKEFFSGWHGAKGYDVNALQRLGCALLISKYRSTAKRIFPALLQDKKRLITFCDAHAPENLLAQMANVVDIKTFTTQHGQYRVLDASNISSDAEAYANFVSNYILCWGEATASEFVRFGFKAEQLIVTGWIKDWDAITPHPSLGVFGVMLNGENGRASNAALLDAAKRIAQSLDLQYVVRLHPWSTPKQYLELLDERCAGIGHYGLSCYLAKIDFGVAHMTGATIEMLYANVPVYLLNDGRLSTAFCADGLSFSSPETIIAARSEDIRFPECARKRTQKLSKWFNDDDAQATRIRAVLLNERS